MPVWTQSEFKAAVKGCGLTAVEWSILTSMSRRDTAEPDVQAHYLAAYHAHPDSGLGAEDYADAIAGTIAKGLCTVLTDASVAAIAEARAAKVLPRLEDYAEHLPGVLDFTQSGFDLTRELRVGGAGIEHVMYNESGWNVNAHEGLAEVLAETEGIAGRRIDELVGAPEVYIRDGAAIQRVEPPIPIGAWRPLRFITIPSGYLARVHYSAEGAPDFAVS